MWWGSYLTATSTYFKDNNSPSAGYGIYSSNTKAPGYGLFAHDYASNMNDSAYYVGACPDCNVTLDDVHGENAPQGYSGTNSGGHVLVENSEFDNNMVGFATGDLNNDDAPGPQDGTCPGNARQPEHPCRHPAHARLLGLHQQLRARQQQRERAEHRDRGRVPTGSGVSIYGGRHDVFVHNRFVHNGAWGIIFTPFPTPRRPRR